MGDKKVSDGSGSDVAKETVYELIDDLQKLSELNIECYRSDSTASGQRLLTALNGIKENLEKSRPIIKQVDEFAHQYDFDVNTPGNGYSGFVVIYKAAVKHSLKIARYTNENKNSLLFRKQVSIKELEVCHQMLSGLFLIFENLIKLHEESETGDLYSKAQTQDNLISQTAKVLNQYCFYGRGLGFQFCDSIKPIVKFIMFSMATYSEGYYSTGLLKKTTNSMYNSGRYYMDPELCAQRIVNILNNANIEFLKNYWCLGEGKLLQVFPNMINIKVQINKVFTIPPEDLKIYSEKLKKMVSIPVPSSHTGKRPVHARLLSSQCRNGMVGERQNCLKFNSNPPSKYLIFHVHGGGWCATNSKSHEMYLREWTDKLGIPIFSIDYSLAPEVPYPGALEDIYYAYCWVLKHYELLGFTGEHIIFVGDSAGATLNSTCIAKCIENGIKLPDGMLICYGPAVLNFTHSPSRFMSLFDPLLSYGLILNCIKSYVGQTVVNQSETVETKSLTPDTPKDYSKIAYDDILEETATEPKDDLRRVWERAQLDSELNAWQTNLGSIRESASEDGSSSSRKSTPIKENEELPKNKSLAPKSRTPSEDTIVFDVSKEAVSVESLQKKLQNITTSVVNAISAPFKSDISKSDSAKEPKRRLLKSEIPHISNDSVFTIPNDPYISPYLISNDILKEFPPTDVVVSLLDPCIDDCVMFAKKLRDSGVLVHLQIFDDLPHGFLNFTRVSKECQQASKACIDSMRKLFKINDAEKEECEN